jgi:mRNA-degrading endonuclease HigB of HigAB toxin-antitoxin module
MAAFRCPDEQWEIAVDPVLRIVTAIHFNHNRLDIRHVFTHAEYERWSTSMRILR